MGIPVKTATIQEDYAWIWKEDEAIDKSREGWEAEYDAALESGDMDRMPLRGGVKPTVFWLRHPSRALERFWQDQWSKGTETAARKIVATAVVKAEHLGVPSEWAGRDPEGGFPCVPDATMEILDGVKGLVNDIAVSVLKEAKKA